MLTSQADIATSKTQHTHISYISISIVMLAASIFFAYRVPFFAQRRGAGRPKVISYVKAILSRSKWITSCLANCSQ